MANIAAHAGHLTSPEEIQIVFDMPRYNAAKNIGLKNYGVYEGADANLILLQAASAVEALRKKPERLYVIREGKILVQNTLKTTYADHIPT